MNKTIRAFLAIVAVSLFSCGKSTTSAKHDLSSSSAAINYGTLTDSRDSQTYKTVVIGTQTWMAQNLNFNPPAMDSSRCYNDSISNCNTYGRLYNWDAAEIVCPLGWHLPDTTEWNTLVRTVGVDSAAIKLSAKSTLWKTNVGTNSFGFSALPAGDYESYNDNEYILLGEETSWWTTAQRDAVSSHTMGFYDGGPSIDMSYDGRYSYHSVRCIQSSP